MSWSRRCLITNFIFTILSIIGATVFIILIFQEFQKFLISEGFAQQNFQSIPHTNIWEHENCSIVSQGEGLFRIDINRTGQKNLCAREQNVRNSTENVSCYVPPVPMSFDQCSSRTPIQNLVLLDNEEHTVQLLLERHLYFYISAWVSGVLAITCFFWFCYSYWFTWCACPENGYWCCGRSRSDYQKFFSDIIHPDTIDHFRFTLTDD